MPEHSSLCLRQKILKVQIPHRRADGQLHLLMDSIGIEFLWEREWQARQHGVQGRGDIHTFNGAPLSRRVTKPIAPRITTAGPAGNGGWDKSSELIFYLKLILTKNTHVRWVHCGKFLRSAEISQRPQSMLMLRARVFQILDGDPASASPGARIINLIITIAILLSVMVVIIESYQPLYEAEKEFFIVFERVIIAFFTLEFLLRLWARGAAYAAENGGAWRGCVSYLTSFHGIVDLLSIAPFYLQFMFPGADLRILRLLRLLRLLKVSRYNSALEDLMRAIMDERRSFVATLYILTIALTLSSALMYYVESSVQPDKLASIPHAMYWSIITLTTVGYGDISPVTPVGKVISSITALLGVSTVAMLTGIVASSFSNQLARRRRIFEKQLEEAYNDGILTAQENAMLEELKVRFGLSDEEVESMKQRKLKRQLRDAANS